MKKKKVLFVLITLIFLLILDNFIFKYSTFSKWMLKSYFKQCDYYIKKWKIFYKDSILWYEDNLVKNQNINNFKEIGSCFATDWNKVYYRWEEINWVWLNNFKIIYNWFMDYWEIYLTDNKNIYYYSIGSEWMEKDIWTNYVKNNFKIINWVDIDSFSVINIPDISWYSKDKNSIYYEWNKIKADVKNFKLWKKFIWEVYYDSKDKKNYFYEWNIVK